MTVFGYLILISIDFYDFSSPFSSQLQFRLRRYIRHPRQCLATFPNTSKFVKNTPLCVVFSTVFLVFENVVKHSLSCLIYYLKNLAFPQETNFEQCNIQAPSTLRQGNVKMQQSPVILDLWLKKTRAARHHDYRNVNVFENLRFQNVFRPQKETQNQRFHSARCEECSRLAAIS